MPVFFSLAAQYENMGDETINALLVREISQRSELIALRHGVPEWYVDNILATPELDKSRIRFVDSPTRFIRDIGIAVISQQQSVFFTSCGDVTPQGETWLRDGMLVALQHLPSLRMATAGMSMSRLSQSREMLLRTAVRRGGKLTVRDARTQSMLMSAGISTSLLPDLAFLLPTVSSTPKDLLVLSFRQAAAVKTESLLDSLTQFVRVASDWGLSTLVTWQVEHDAPYCRYLAERLNVRAEGIEPRERFRFDRMCGIYDRASLVLSNRLHVLLVAASRGALPFPLIHESEVKVRAVFEGMGLEGNILQPSDSPMRINWNPSKEPFESLPLVRCFERNAIQLRAFFDELFGNPQFET